MNRSVLKVKASNREGSIDENNTQQEERSRFLWDDYGCTLPESFIKRHEIEAQSDHTYEVCRISISIQRYFS
jgi:hypothetical protein